MRTLSKIFDEIPSTREGLKIYIKSMEKEFFPIKKKYDRMKKLFDEATRRFDNTKILTESFSKD